jgi:cytoskeletal protein CcmA (bactofilin family)
MHIFHRLRKKRTLDLAKDLYKKPKAETTIIGRHVFIKGILNCRGNVRLSGRFSGKISSPGMILLEKGASVKGDLSSGHAIIYGSVDGEINVKGKVELGRSSRVKGDIMAGTLAVERGAFLSGNAVSRLSELIVFTDKRIYRLIDFP